MTISIEQIFMVFASISVLLMGLNSIKYRTTNDGNGGVYALVNKLDERDSAIAKLKKENAESGAESELLVDRLNGENAVLINKVALMQAIIDEDHSHKEFDRPKLLLISTTESMQRTDEMALNRADVYYRRIVNANKVDIENELRRRRQEGFMYDYIVITAHMCSEGIMMQDGSILEPYWLNVNLFDIKLLILNGCESTEIAGELVGVVDYVISMTEKVPNKVAGSFLFAFWDKIRQGDDILSAYGYAKVVEPSVAPYVDLLIKTGV